MPRDTAASKRNREQDMDLYYNPLDRACKSIVGAIPRKKVVTLNVYKERYPAEKIISPLRYVILFYGETRKTINITR